MQSGLALLDLRISSCKTLVVFFYCHKSFAHNLKFTTDHNIWLNVCFNFHHKVCLLHTGAGSAVHHVLCNLIYTDLCRFIWSKLGLVRSCQCKSLPRILFSSMTFSSVDTIIFVARVLGFAAGDMFLVVLASIMHK